MIIIHNNINHYIINLIVITIFNMSIRVDTYDRRQITNIINVKHHAKPIIIHK